MNCSLTCPCLVIGDYGYKCKKFQLGLKTKGDMPERYPQCEDDVKLAERGDDGNDGRRL